jgi:hypothetical protein
MLSILSKLPLELDVFHNGTCTRRAAANVISRGDQKSGRKHSLPREREEVRACFFERKSTDVMVRFLLGFNLIPGVGSVQHSSSYRYISNTQGTYINQENCCVCSTLYGTNKEQRSRFIVFDYFLSTVQ